MPSSRAHPASDHHPPVAFGTATAATAGVEPLGDATKLRAPRDELVEPLLCLLSDADARATGLLAETRDAAGGRALLLLRRGAGRGPTSGSEPRTTIWSSSTVTSTPVNQPSGSLPANQPLIDPSSFSSMITTLRRNSLRCKAPPLPQEGSSPAAEPERGHPPLPLGGEGGSSPTGRSRERGRLLPPRLKAGS